MKVGNLLLPENPKRVISLKVKCPDCKHKFEIDENDFDEGDYLNCPECNLELTVQLNVDNRIKIKIARDKELDEDEENFDEDIEE